VAGLKPVYLLVVEDELVVERGNIERIFGNQLEQAVAGGTFLGEETVAVELAVLVGTGEVRIAISLQHIVVVLQVEELVVPTAVEVGSVVEEAAVERRVFAEQVVDLLIIAPLPLLGSNTSSPA
jgi:hypothetical protein